jgi:uncharacterized membrane protein YecN with MAPEG domain
MITTFMKYLTHIKDYTEPKRKLIYCDTPCKDNNQHICTEVNIVEYLPQNYVSVNIQQYLIWLKWISVLIYNMGECQRNKRLQFVNIYWK